MLDDKQAWKKFSVKRDRKHEPLVDMLCSAKTGNKSIFNYNKDLMVFAAMVGYSKGKRKPLSSDGISIILETYASDQKDAFIYLIILITERDGASLKDENLQSSIKIFEEYCNAGLEEIQLWLDESPGDYEGIDTLVQKIYEQVIDNERQTVVTDNPEDIEPDF
jgi:dnd system-associated protein 4